MPGLNRRVVALIANPTNKTLTVLDGVGGDAVIDPLDPRKYEAPGVSPENPSTSPAE
jgi:hypothetical protein